MSKCVAIFYSVCTAEVN